MVVLNDEFTVVGLAVDHIIEHVWLFVFELGHKWHFLTASLPLVLLLLQCLVMHEMSMWEVVGEGVVLVGQNASVLIFGLKMAAGALFVAGEGHTLRVGPVLLLVWTHVTLVVFSHLVLTVHWIVSLRLSLIEVWLSICLLMLRKAVCEILLIRLIFWLEPDLVLHAGGLLLASERVLKYRKVKAWSALDRYLLY